jgi:hypothetical protein
VSDQPGEQPVYWRLLRLRHVRPGVALRVAFTVGATVVGVLLALAGLASAWGIIILPAAIAVAVKANDVIAGQLRSR